LYTALTVCGIYRNNIAEDNNDKKRIRDPFHNRRKENAEREKVIRRKGKEKEIRTGLVTN
jgi:hypothetical protein